MLYLGFVNLFDFEHAQVLFLRDIECIMTETLVDLTAKDL
jgi:hypothetical protein